MAKAGKKSYIKCQCCEEAKPREQFADKPTLWNGVDVWCVSCVNYLNLQREAGNQVARDLQKQYTKHYQQSYHKRRRAALGEDGRKGTQRSRARAIRHALEQKLPQKFAFNTLKRESVQRELIRLLDALKQTPSWIQFEDELISESGLEQLGVKGRLEVTRTLPIQLYPELALVKGNCVVQIRSGARVVKRTAFQFTYEQVIEGFALLAKAVLEV